LDSAYFQRLARYNAWANRRLYEACGSLSREDYVAPRPSFFGSIHRTLNHLLVGDRLWMSRFEGVPHGLSSLDQVLHDDFAALRAARVKEDDRIRRWADRLDDRVLDGDLEYRNMAGEAKRTALRWAIAHFFNHQTHHRGQAHCLLSGTPAAPPPLDLLYFLPEDRG
jgi:uncharacterized damage-inducible protein DinB